MGHREELLAFVSLLSPAVPGADPSAASAERLREAEWSTRTALAAREALRTRTTLEVNARPPGAGGNGARPEMATMAQAVISRAP